MTTKPLTSEDKIFIAIESLLRTSGHCGQLVSVTDESSKYCYKTFDGSIGTIDKDFINDRAKNINTILPY